MRSFCILIGGSLLFVVVFVITLNSFIYLSTRSYIYTDVADAPSAVVALVPGAALALPNVLSSIFIERLDTAIALYKAKKVWKILVSGDDSTLFHNEVNPARVYLLGKGIPDEDIFLDHAGLDTYSSLYRARDVFGVTKMIVTTQSFHLPRAVFIGQKLGMEVYGVSADTSPLPLYNYLREVFANEKALLNLLLKRTPKYLGEPIPITTDGRTHR
jgi:SanA protein